MEAFSIAITMMAYTMMRVQEYTQPVVEPVVYEVPAYQLSARAYLEPEDPYSIESCWAAWDENQKEYLYDLCEEYDLDYRIMGGVIYNESNFIPTAVGHNTNGTSDWGLGQINDVCYSFVKQHVNINSMEDLLDPYKNMRAMCAIMDYHKDATGDDVKALLRYQVGEGAYARMMARGETSTVTQAQVLAFANKL